MKRKGNETHSQAREPNTRHFKLLLWTIGLNGACNLILGSIFKRECDIVKVNETFLTEWQYIDCFYDYLFIASQGQKGRPYGEIP
jgi:hypothetical protein